eukprot:3171703-Pleurochrysis_carterae.AAC.1
MAMTGEGSYRREPPSDAAHHVLECPPLCSPHTSPLCDLLWLRPSSYSTSAPSFAWSYSFSDLFFLDLPMRAVRLPCTAMRFAWSYSFSCALRCISGRGGAATGSEIRQTWYADRVRPYADRM